jgi:hypothetical protein
MEPLQLIMFESAMQAQRRLIDSSLPGAPQVPYRPSRRHETLAGAGRGARTQLAGLLRRTADRVDPCPAPSAS